mmetsp:Transcript_39825/g.66817  ORF Transcript_39825/g.66817 Transcript_39825/m.66817 type:complete len:235 (+) Transcript_39825:175-879(+)
MPAERLEVAVLHGGGPHGAAVVVKEVAGAVRLDGHPVQRQRQVHAVAAAQRLNAVLHAQVDQRHRNALLVAGHRLFGACLLVPTSHRGRTQLIRMFQQARRLAGGVQLDGHHRLLDLVQRGGGQVTSIAAGEELVPESRKGTGAAALQHREGPKDGGQLRGGELLLGRLPGVECGEQGWGGHVELRERPKELHGAVRPQLSQLRHLQTRHHRRAHRGRGTVVRVRQRAQQLLHL